jgi:hypothetical protein
MWRCRRSVIVLAVCIGLTCSARALRAEDSPCDPQLKPPEGDPNAYRLRGDRCEGIYIREVSGAGALRVVSFTESFEDFDSTSGAPLQVEWSPFGNAAVRLRADQLGRKLYYRMDAQRPAGATSFTWPSNVLAVFALRRDEIGIVAWTPFLVGPATRDVYLPLRIRQQGPSVESPSYSLAVVPGADLSEVFVSIATLGTDGRPTDFLMRDKPLEYGYYPAGRKIVIKISDLPADGLYYVELGGRLADGRSTTTTLWFHHARG